MERMSKVSPTWLAGRNGADRLPWTTEQVYEATVCWTCHGSGKVDGPLTKAKRQKPFLRRATELGNQRREVNPGHARHGDTTERDTLDSTTAELSALIEQGRHVGLTATDLLKAAGMSRQALALARKRLEQRPRHLDYSTEVPVVEPLDECPNRKCRGQGFYADDRKILLSAASLGQERQRAAYTDLDTVDNTTRLLWNLAQEAAKVGIPTVRVAEAAGMSAPALYDAHRRLGDPHEISRPVKRQVPPQSQGRTLTAEDEIEEAWFGR
jgi:hypothetical protein